MLLMHGYIDEEIRGVRARRQDQEPLTGVDHGNGSGGDHLLCAR